MITRIAVAAFTIHLIHSAGAPSPGNGTGPGALSATGLRDLSGHAVSLCMEKPHLCQIAVEKAARLAMEGGMEGGMEKTTPSPVDFPLPPRRPAAKKS